MLKVSHPLITRQYRVRDSHAPPFVGVPAPQTELASPAHSGRGEHLPTPCKVVKVSRRLQVREARCRVSAVPAGEALQRRSCSLALEFPLTFLSELQPHMLYISR